MFILIIVFGKRNKMCAPGPVNLIVICYRHAMRNSGGRKSKWHRTNWRRIKIIMWNITIRLSVRYMYICHVTDLIFGWTFSVLFCLIKKCTSWKYLDWFLPTNRSWLTLKNTVQVDLQSLLICPLIYSFNSVYTNLQH